MPFNLTKHWLSVKIYILYKVNTYNILNAKRWTKKYFTTCEMFPNINKLHVFNFIDSSQIINKHWKGKFNGNIV